jgi:glutamate synthase (NADPH/NADH) large chain
VSSFKTQYLEGLKPFLSFTDGDVVGATLDRNGLRPSRYCVLNDDTVIMSSEAGSLIVDESKVIKKGRLQPGKLFVADLKNGKIISDEELKDDICSRKPYGRWLKENKLTLTDIARPRRKSKIPFKGEDLLQNQIAFGFTREDLTEILKPMAEGGKEPLGSMGADTPLAILSTQAQHLANYFKQLFAQVSNPPIDPIREAVIMSLYTNLGPQRNILAETPEHCRQVHLDTPILSNGQLDKIKKLDDDSFKSYVINATFSATNRSGALERAIDEAKEASRQNIKQFINKLIYYRQTTENLHLSNAIQLKELKNENEKLQILLEMREPESQAYETPKKRLKNNDLSTDSSKNLNLSKKFLNNFE